MHACSAIPREHQLEGFGQWEFLTILGFTLSGEASDVHMDKWDFKNKDNEYRMDARAAEARRMVRREPLNDKTAFLTLQDQSGLAALPNLPLEREPRDFDRFFDEMQTRFRLSTTESLTTIQNFRPFPYETLDV